MKIKSGLRVSIDAEALERIWHWTDMATGEFSCLGLVTDDVLAHDVRLFDQICTAASTDIDQQALAKFLVAHDQPENVRLWCHSHGNLQVFWSQQDDSCIEGLANDTFLLSLVVNKKREMKCRLDIWKPVRVTLDDLEVTVRLPEYGLKRECERMFLEHVIEAQPIATQQRWEPHRQGQGKPLQRVMQGWPSNWNDDDDEIIGWRGM